MRVLDLFSGIGGFSLGLERAGMRTVAFCEIEPFARRVLRKHWPEVPTRGEVTKCEFKQGEADVITAGFPCQDVSFAGAGAGLAGERSGLVWEVVRAIRLVRPKRAILENVAALLNRGLGSILGALAEIGYDAEWHCIPAAAVGAPHRRDRIWIVAHAGGEQHEGYRSPLSGALAAELLKADMADPAWLQPGRAEQWPERQRIGPSCEPQTVADANGEQGRPEQQQCFSPRAGTREQPTGRGWWLTEPDVGRVAHGVPARVDRLRGLGNAVVPQIPELIGRAIMAAEREEGLPATIYQPSSP